MVAATPEATPAKAGPLVAVPAPKVAPGPSLDKAAAGRIAVFESQIEADPYDIAAWDGRLREAVQSGKPVDIFERAVKQLPWSVRIWTAYAEWSEAQDVLQALAVYNRCLQQVPSLDLWSSYLACCKRHQSMEDVLRAYNRAVDVLGSDWRAGLLWSEYITILKKIHNAQRKKENPDAEVSGVLLAEDTNPIEISQRAMKGTKKKDGTTEEVKKTDIGEDALLRCGEVLKIDIEFMRSMFQRAVGTAHASIDKLWVNYEQFEKARGVPAEASKILAEHMPRYIKAKGSFKEIQTRTQGIEHFAIAVPLKPKNAAQQSKQMEKWRGILQYERTNPLRIPRTELQARVSLLYQQAALGCAFHAELWHDFAAWLDLGGQHEQASAALRRAVERFLPQDLTLRLLVAHRHELAEEPNLEEADDTYAKLLEDMPKPSPLALLNYLAFVRRQRGAHEFRQGFLEATENSPHCTWEVYVFAALTEYHVFGSTDAASTVFRLGLERYGEREPSLLVAYVNFLVGANDMRSARAELSRGVLDRLQAGVRDSQSNRTADPMVRDSLVYLWQKWARLERYFGDADAVRRAVMFRDEEYRNLQRDAEVEEDAVLETPVTLGLSATISEVEEGFRFHHLVPETAKAMPSSQKPATPGPINAQARSSATASGVLDQTLADAADENKLLGRSTGTSGISSHIARPDVSKMLAFRPALDVVGSKRSVDGRHRAEEGQPMPVMIPKCLQDLLAVLPSRPLKGAKPDVDYLLTVLQTITIPPIPVKELENFRYDSLRLHKDEDRGVKDEVDGERGGFFSSRPTVYRERLQMKRQKVAEEPSTAMRVKVGG